jgi:hypothetical protein
MFELISQKTLDRFWEKVDKGDGEGCWRWTAIKNHKGYGQFMMRYDRGKARPFVTHRVSWMIANGSIDDGLFVCHHCDVRVCVNPSHLFLGTADDNTKDMMAKGRHRCDTSNTARGENQGHAKLTEEKVIAMRAEFVAGSSKAHLAEKYGVSLPNVYHVIARNTWKHF